MATDWRWPPESRCTGSRRLTKLGLMRAMTSRVARSMALPSKGRPAGHDLAAEKQVGDRVEVIGKRQILIEGLDAEIPWHRGGCGW